MYPILLFEKWKWYYRKTLREAVSLPFRGARSGAPKLFRISVPDLLWRNSQHRRKPMEAAGYETKKKGDCEGNLGKTGLGLGPVWENGIFSSVLHPRPFRKQKSGA
jgi:hypothetical protein